MKKLTELAINRPLLILVIFTVLILFGVISYKSLNYTLLPKFDAPVVTIITTYRGASAEEIENSVTKHIEDAVSSLEGVDKINATSMENASMVIVQLKNGVDVDQAQNDAQRKVNQITGLMPSDIDNPIVNKFNTDDFPVLQIGVSANLDDKELFDLVDKQVKPQLNNVTGVGQVNLYGGREREIQVNLDRKKLEAYGLTVSQVSQMIQFASLSTPAGSVENTTDQYGIKFDAKFDNPDQLRTLIIGRDNQGGKIYLKDVGEVVNGIKDATTLNRTNGLPSIGMSVLKQGDANAVQVSKLSQEKLSELEKTYERVGLKFQLSSDQSIYTLSSANAVMVDLGLAVVVVSLVMLFFLHSFRSSLFVLVALPASIIPTFIMMFLFGMSLNLMTLLALSLVVGILVDDSIVILENIMRHMEMGKDRRKATVDGRSEIGFTAVSITLVDVVVFLPMAMVTGMIGNILREFSLVVVTSTLMSLFVCFTLTPLLASHFGKLVHLNNKTLWGRINIWFENLLENAKNKYANILSWSLDHKRWILGGTFLLFIGSIMLVAFGFIGSSFITKGDRSEMLVKLELDPTASLQRTNELSRQVEAMLLRDSLVTNVFTLVGASNNGMSNVTESNTAELNVKLVDAKKRKITTEQYGINLEQKLSKIPGLKVTVSEIGITGNADQKPIMILTKGNNREEIRKAANMIFDVVNSVPGTRYPEFSTKNPKPQINISLDREKMALFGLNSSVVAQNVATAFRGNDASKFKYDGNEYDILVRADENFRSGIQDVRNLKFTNESGQSFTLGQFAKIEEELGESVLQRMDRLPSITVTSQIQGRALSEVTADIEKGIEKLKLPDGVTWQYDGEVKNQQDAASSLLGALAIGILLVYLIMVALYENAVYPFVVLFALPLAIIGALLALALTMNELSIFSMIGIIMLMGLVAKNGILLVDFTNQRKAEGASLVEALIDAGKERFRPILMTTIAMIAGMLPIALATGDGAEVKNGMAWVIIGGLTSSLILTLVVVPCVYYIVDRIMIRYNVRKRRRRILKERALA